MNTFPEQKPSYEGFWREILPYNLVEGSLFGLSKGFSGFSVEVQHDEGQDDQEVYLRA